MSSSGDENNITIFCLNNWNSRNLLTAAPSRIKLSFPKSICQIKQKTINSLSPKLRDKVLVTQNMFYIFAAVQQEVENVCSIQLLSY